MDYDSEGLLLCLNIDVYGWNGFLFIEAIETWEKQA